MPWPRSSTASSGQRDPRLDPAVQAGSAPRTPTRRLADPSDRMVISSPRRENAMKRPSGDQAGSSLFTVLGVNVRSPPPSRPITPICTAPAETSENAIRRPSGEKLGSNCGPSAPSLRRSGHPPPSGPPVALTCHPGAEKRRDHAPRLPSRATGSSAGSGQGCRPVGSMPLPACSRRCRVGCRVVGRARQCG